MKVIYIANARIPTEKAHGVQIFKTCEALASVGTDLELWLPARKQLPSLENVSPFDFYECRKIFRIHKFPTLDFLTATNKFGGRVDAFSYLLQEISFVFSVLLFGNLNESTVYTRCLTAAALIKVLRQNKVFYEAHSIPQSRIPQFFYRFLLERLDGVVTISTGLKELLNLPRKTPVEVINNAVDMGKYLSIGRTEARKELKIPGNKKYVIYTGFISRGRGIFTLLNAADILKNTDITFLLVGRIDSTDEKQLRTIKENGGLKNVIFAGYVQPPVVPLYQKAADVLVLPSGQETVPWDKKYGT